MSARNSNQRSPCSSLPGSVRGAWIECYYEYHRGAYTTHSRLKVAFRQLETAQQIRETAVAVRWDAWGEIALLTINSRAIALRAGAGRLVSYPDRVANFEAWEVDRQTLAFGQSGTASAEIIAAVEHDGIRGFLPVGNHGIAPSSAMIGNPPFQLFSGNCANIAQRTLTSGYDRSIPLDKEE